MVNRDYRVYVDLRDCRVIGVTWVSLELGVKLVCLVLWAWVLRLFRASLLVVVRLV